MFKLRVPKFLKSVRYCLAGVNVLFLLTGLMLLALGIAVLLVYQEYEEFITQRFFSLPSFVIATGAIILVTSVLGFYCAYSEQFYFILVYVSLTLVILVFEMAIVITSFGLRNDASSEIRTTMLSSLQQYENRREVAILWDNLQIGFECCGVAGRHDWPQNRLPVSCCLIDFGTISPFECTTNNAYMTGCASVLGEWLSHNAHVMAYIALPVMVIQVLIVSASGWLAYRSKFEEVELES
ncbi:tetraspanin-9-like [Ostrinia nubilalis]|uniref:tetraspanin-9-like n=1 Tax=Ostrinia nubilalis TaxID=29057 RepID=UPI003082649C